MLIREDENSPRDVRAALSKINSCKSLGPGRRSILGVLTVVKGEIANPVTLITGDPDAGGWLLLAPLQRPKQVLLNVLLSQARFTLS